MKDETKQEIQQQNKKGNANMSSSKEEIARREGMSYAFRYAKEHGLDGLEKELKY